MQTLKTQSGHIVFEGVLALAVVVLAGFAVLTYQSHMKSQSTSSATTAAALTSTAKAAAANDKQSQAALAHVKAFYEAYLASPLIGTAEVSYSQQQGYVTPAVVTAYIAYAKANKADLVTCSQNALAYSAYKFSNPVVDGATATMLASAVYAGSPPSTNVIKLGLKEVGSVWQVNSISCPTGAKAATSTSK